MKKSTAPILAIIFAIVTMLSTVVPVGAAHSHAPEQPPILAPGLPVNQDPQITENVITCVDYTWSYTYGSPVSAAYVCTDPNYGWEPDTYVLNLNNWAVAFETSNAYSTVDYIAGFGFSRAIHPSAQTYCTNNPEGVMGYVYMSTTAVTTGSPREDVSSVEIRCDQEGYNLASAGQLVTGGSGYARIWVRPVPTLAAFSIALGSSRVELGSSGCSNDVMILDNMTPAVIDPTVELPDSNTTQYLSVVNGGLYRLTVDGGPWIDPVNEHFETEISWDGTTWISFQELILEAACTDLDYDNPWLGTLFIYAESSLFMIRVMDEPGQFADNDNIQAMEYSMSLGQQTGPLECGDQWTYDPVTDLVASGTIEANNAWGTSPAYQFVVNDWYAVAITGGEWYDGGLGPLHFAKGTFFLDNEFYIGPEGVLPDATVGCRELIGDYYTVYVQATSTSLNLIVPDANDNFADNTGSLDYAIYKTAYDWWPEGCAAEYEINAFWTSGTVNANQSNGTWMATSVDASSVTAPTLQGGAYYVIDITGGPWQDSAFAKSYQVTFSTDAGNTWYESSDWPEATCVEQYDPVGHKKVFFRAQPIIPGGDGRDYDIRVNYTGTNWAGNTGSMTYTIYSADWLKDDPPGGQCQYEMGEMPIDGGEIDINAENGTVRAASLTRDYIYALEFTNGPWQEGSGGADRFDGQISDSSGEFFDPENWPATVCSETVGDYVRIFFREPAWAATTFPRLRVNSDSFGDNTGQLQYAIYGTTGGSLCFDNKAQYVINSYESIPVKMEDGNLIVNDIPYVPPGGSKIGSGQPLIAGSHEYALEIQDGPWNNGVDIDYDAALSSDGGATWFKMDEHPDITCAELEPLKRYWKVKITADPGQSWKIRVNDTEGSFADNGGDLAYKLYILTDPNDPPPWDDDGGGGNPPPGSAGDVCTQPNIRPASALDLAAWIGYYSNEIVYFFAWCPRHTAIIQAVYAKFLGRDPMAWFTEMNTVMKSSRAELESYDWSEDASTMAPSQMSIARVYGLVPADDSLSSLTTEDGLQRAMDAIGGGAVDQAYANQGIQSPFDGGQINIRDTRTPVFSTECNTALAETMGYRLAQPVCFATNAMRETGVSFWISVILDSSCIFMFLGYLWNVWVKGFFR